MDKPDKPGLVLTTSPLSSAAARYAICVPLNAVGVPSNRAHVPRSGDKTRLGLIRIQVVFHELKTRTGLLPE
ncbi:MAG: hypothetical protein JXB30_04910 [Anaerolineae bacterium]|nr:hypothetical protein [Anaerolineae bacterium]